MLKLVVRTVAGRFLMVNMLPLTNNNYSRFCRTQTHTHKHTQELIVNLIVQNEVL